jgi:elongation factor Ts
MSVTISAALVKELRERTNAGMMECKKALEVSQGDMEKAVEELRKSGRAKADKKAGRVAAEGIIAVANNGKQVAIVEVNCETDFVGRDENFTAFAKQVAETALSSKEVDVAKLSALPIPGSSTTVEEARQSLITKVGENVQIRRAVLSDASAASVGTYVHGTRIGVVVELDTDNEELARDIAMHIAASKPIVVSPEQVSADLVAKEKEIVEKMVVGRIKKFLDEVSLTGQPFVKDPEVTVGGLLNKHRAKVLRFQRFEVGEGIEKVVEDFREAVMSQVQGG